MKYRIGIDLGGTNIKVGVVDEKNQIIKRNSVPTQVERPYTEIIKRMCDAVKDTLELCDVLMEDCEKLGVGSPGTIDSRNGIVVYSNNFEWKNIHLVEEMKKYLPLPISVNNDANCAALGEAVAGAAKGYKNVVLLTLGTGIGSGIILDGKIFEGGHAGGAEFGHNVIRINGERCSCGRSGCFEAYASATALIRDTKRAAAKSPESAIHALCKNEVSNIDGTTAFAAMEMGDPAGKMVVHNYIYYLSEGIANIINLFRPDRILISGGVCNQGATLTDPVNEMLKEMCFGGKDGFIAPVLQAELSNDAGIIGAANL